MATVKAKVVRDCYVRGKQVKVGDVVDLTHQEFSEMRTTYYVVRHEEPEAPVVEAALAVDVVAKEEVKPVEPEQAKKVGKGV